VGGSAARSFPSSPQFSKISGAGGRTLSNILQEIESSVASFTSPHGKSR